MFFVLFIGSFRLSMNKLKGIGKYLWKAKDKYDLELWRNI